MGRYVDREHLVGRDESGHYGFEELVLGGLSAFDRAYEANITNLIVIYHYCKSNISF